MTCQKVWKAIHSLQVEIIGHDGCEPEGKKGREKAKTRDPGMSSWGLQETPTIGLVGKKKKPGVEECQSMGT